MFTQIYGLSDPDEIEAGAQAYALGFIGMAVGAGLASLIAVSQHDTSTDTSTYIVHTVKPEILALH